ncbi:MAG: hypothetical protein ACPGJV_09350 [Bacteriovoracaceae bacterium]
MRFWFNRILLFISFLGAFAFYAQSNTNVRGLANTDSKTKKPPETVFQKQAPKDEVLNFDSIKEVIKNDNLSQHLSKTQKKKAEAKKKKEAGEVARYIIPDEGSLYRFLSELWIIKNVSILKWDFKKPDYGIEIYFKDFLEKIGILNLKFKILLVNTPMVTHFALPSNKSEAIFLLSLPFIRTLDLTKLEISLLLLEDLLRIEADYFKNHLVSKEVKALLGTNFHNNPEFKVDPFLGILKKYDDLIYEKGFSFKQQFTVTKKMDRILKGNLSLWNRYYLLIQKIKDLSDTNYLYKHHVKIYPSPELQLNWLKPTEEQK